MKKLSLLLIIFAVSTALLAQKKSYYNESGNKVKAEEAVYYRTVSKNGSKFSIKEYYAANNQLKSKGSYTHGSGADQYRNGRFEFYYLDGQLHYKVRYKNGKPEGEYIAYHKNAKEKAKGNYFGGQESGDWVYYHENGQISAKGMYFAGEYNGDWVWYYEDGTVKRKGRYKNGKRDGDYLTFYENGKAHVKCYYEMDSLWGRYSSHWDNGNKAAEGVYYDNKKDSTWYWYHKNGNMSCRVLYERGEFNNGDYYNEDGEESPKRVREGNLVRLPKYPGGLDKMVQLVMNRMEKQEINLKQARKARYKVTTLFEVEIDEKGTVTDVKMLMPNEEKPYSDPFNVVEAFRDAILDLPDLTPMLAYNRNVETTVYFVLRFDATKKTLSISPIGLED